MSLSAELCLCYSGFKASLGYAANPCLKNKTRREEGRTGVECWGWVKVGGEGDFSLVLGPIYTEQLLLKFPVALHP